MKNDMIAILGEDFFKEEVRCNYFISKEMKYMWAMQLDLFLVFSEICNRHNLKFFLYSGGLLGAIRHNGFIPWDDDLDVAMPRADYNEFVKVAPSELSEPYALQNPYTYPNCLYSIATLRNGMGTFTSKIFKNLDYNKGIPLDIFPIDFCNPDTFFQDRFDIYCCIKRCATYMKWLCGVDSERQMLDLKIYGKDNPLEAWETMHNIASNPQYDGSEFCGVTTIIPSVNAKPRIQRTENYAQSILHKFETIEVPIPIGYDGILTTIYGDYMKLPPENERGKKNNQLIFDPFTPYKEYKF